MRARRHVIRISTVLALLLTVPSARVAGGTAASAAETYSQPFQTAVSQLPVGTEGAPGTPATSSSSGSTSTSTGTTATPARRC